MPLPVLVTGGAGYIGSHTCKALAKAGFLPVTFDNLVYGHEWAVRWGPLIRGDIRDGEILGHAFETYKPVAVLHFAAFAYVGESVVDPGKYYDNNVSGTVSLLNAMRAHGCKTIVFSSSCATYGVPEKVPIGEDHRQEPVNPYGRSKLMIEHIMGDYSCAYGLSYVSLRYFNAAGADPDGKVGEDHDPETHLVPLVIEAALGSREFVEVYGTDYETDDGTAVRDYLHVTDLAQAHVLALRYLVDGNKSMCFNLGTGKGYSVSEVIGAVKEFGGRPVPFRESARRQGDPPILIAEASLAKSELGWEPLISDLKSIIGTAWNWHSNHDFTGSQ
jgi:UDP-arabinose 4-epimerase